MKIYHCLVLFLDGSRFINDAAYYALETKLDRLAGLVILIY